MKHKVKTNWKGNMAFEAIVNDLPLMMDAAEEFGGQNLGPRPKELLLASVSGCTGMDVVAILKKMQVELESFNMEIEADMTEEHPKHYTKMHLIYEFKGKNLDRSKLEKAVTLSQDKYCGVSFMFKKFLEFTYEIRIIES
ncbi:MAG TPA: OsmC family protein [Bacteroidales bacterium]|jgi:putative redox protein|nr:OsmC family protein [Bacteroidales bacterium]HNV96310.1 OsmC family protein [Bacteroidales bacterium]